MENSNNKEVLEIEVSYEQMQHLVEKGKVRIEEEDRIYVIRLNLIDYDL